MDHPPFQFHKGTIRTSAAASVLSSLCDFNSIKVRLEPTPSAISTSSSPYFNSIKVRLEPPIDQQPDEQRLFQFHKGTIRTSDGRQREMEDFYNFNSIKVRLELYDGERVFYGVNGFQFHKGTIRTMCYFWYKGL